MLTTLSFLILSAASPNESTLPHEERFFQLMARYQAASQAGERSLVLCLEPKFRVGKALMAEYPNAGAERQAEITADLTVLEKSSARCGKLRK